MDWKPDRFTFGKGEKKHFSILIPSLQNRTEQRSKLMAFLSSQAKGRDVEILILQDEGQWSVGAKRNVLLDSAQGKFLAFVDDDDWVSDTYVRDIVRLIRTHRDLDCIGIIGNAKYGGHDHKFIHSLSIKTWHEKGGVYYRPPNHLNPIKTNMARPIRFPDVYMGEDAEWSKKLLGAGVLKNEILLADKVTYYYRCWR